MSAEKEDFAKKRAEHLVLPQASDPFGRGKMNRNTLT